MIQFLSSRCRISEAIHHLQSRRVSDWWTCSSNDACRAHVERCNAMASGGTHPVKKSQITMCTTGFHLV